MKGCYVVKYKDTGSLLAAGNSIQVNIYNAYSLELFTTLT